MNGFDAVLSREDLLSRVFAGGESGLRVRETPFFWRDGRLTPNLADVAPTVSYDVKIDSAYERLDVGSLGGPSKNGPDQGGNYCFWLSTAHASGMSGRQIQLQAQDHKARCAPLANQIAKAFGTEKDFGATNVSADTECMCSFVHLCGRDLLLYHSTAKVLWFVSKVGNRGLCTMYNDASFHNGHFQKLVVVRALAVVSTRL